MSGFFDCPGVGSIGDFGDWQNVLHEQIYTVRLQGLNLDSSFINGYIQPVFNALIQEYARVGSPFHPIEQRVRLFRLGVP
jgi:hypothetical protein